MKTKLINWTLTVVSAILIYSCVATSKISTDVSENAKNQTPPEGKSLVYVYRISSLGFAVGLNVSLNDKMLGSFYPKRFYLCTLNPGKYVFTGHGENEDDIIISTEPNKKYYIEARPKMGFASARIELELHDQIDGNNDVQKCKMIGSTDAVLPVASQTVKNEKIQQNISQPVESTASKEASSQAKNGDGTMESSKTITKDTPEKSTFLVGGLNLGQYNTSISSVSVKSDRLTMGHIGYTDVTQYSDKWAMKTGIILSADGGKYSSNTYGVAYASVPIQAQYFFTDIFSAVGGFSFDFGLFSFDDGDVYFDDDSFSRYWNPSLCIGAEAKLNKTFKAYANYSAGLNNILTKDYRTGDEKLTKNVIQFGIGILLKQK